MPRLQRLDPVWYRFRGETLPDTVVFPSVTYTLRIECDRQGTWMWNLAANDFARAAAVNITEPFRTEAWLRQALFVDGFATRHATIGETILQRLVSLKLAERLDAPTRPPEWDRGYPWAWL